MLERHVQIGLSYRKAAACSPCLNRPMLCKIVTLNLDPSADSLATREEDSPQPMSEQTFALQRVA